MRVVVFITMLLACVCFTLAAVEWEGGVIVEDSKFTPKEYEGGALLVAGGAAEEDDTVTNVLWWALDVSDDPVPDSSGGTNGARHSGGPTFVAASASVSAHYSLDGVNDLLVLNPYDDITTDWPITISTWVKSGTSANQHPLSIADQSTNNDELRIYLASSGEFRAIKRVGGTNYQATQAASSNDDDVWRHVQADFVSSNLVNLYVNGTLVASNTTDTAFPSGLDRMLAGARAQLTIEQRLTGEVDDIQVFNGTPVAADEFNDSKTNYGYLAQGADTNTGLIVAQLMEYSGKGADGSENDEHFTVAGAAFTTFQVHGDGGGFYEFDAVNDELNIADDTLYSFGNGTSDEAFTFSAWIRVDDTTGPYATFTKFGGGENEYQWRVSNGIMSLQLRDDSTGSSIEIGGDGTAIIQAGVWVHVVTTYDGSGTTNGFKNYVNGVDKTADCVFSDGGSYTAMENLTALPTIGLRDDSAHDFNGGIDDLRIYKSNALSQAAVTDLFNNTKTTYGHLADGADTNSGLLAAWLMEYPGGDNNKTPDNSLGGTGTGYSLGIQSSAPHAIWTNATSGEVHGGYQLDGSTDYLSRGDGGDWTMADGGGDVAFTIAAWIKPDVTNANGSILTKSGTTSREWEFYNGNGGEVRFMVRDHSASAFLQVSSDEGTVSTNEWHFVVGTYDGSATTNGLLAYVDGVAASDEEAYIESGTYVGMEDLTATVEIGRRNTGDQFFDGQIGEVWIWKSNALSAAAITDLYNATTNRYK